MTMNLEEIREFAGAMTPERAREVILKLIDLIEDQHEVIADEVNDRLNVETLIDAFNYYNEFNI